MKKVLIFSHSMEIGGAESALLGLLETIDKSQYQVDLFLMRHSGEMMSFIPSGINLLPEITEYSCIEIPMVAALKRRQYGITCGRMLGKILAKVKEISLHYEDSYIPLEYSHKFTKRYMPTVSDEVYDLAISFQSPHYFVIDKVKAKKKIAWIHTDYSAIRIDRESELKMWSQYDHIVSISEAITENFLKVFPELKDKLVLIENMIPTSYISSMSTSTIAADEMPEDGSTKLLSIGRFCAAKNFESIPEICKYLITFGHNVKWYIIGYGDGQSAIEEKIVNAGMEERVIILGKKANPYPYIKSCDLYVQPSKYEGKSIAVREAQFLGKPVVITAYPSSSSQLHDGVDGVIVPMENDECAKGISDILNDRLFMATLKEHCINKNTNDYEVNKLYTLFGE